ncbi:MAG: type I DNA topoisomerase [Candidatus Dormibacteraeota bacterium]|uniref:DNA topoisomerase 1 n=1 Tax=Candidatus Aeolococcus gillhamiae TaxID=3127015 RepID=A0A934N6N5_9BACT|nr:type I DNA topoisomerase [Candidatus Dormibacteraeota bacterium]
MPNRLIIVESPSKARTLAKFLGAGYTVKASMGHVRDLPKSKIGVDIDAGFVPEYQVIKGKEKQIKELQAASRKADSTLLAADPDREGEAIAWHIAQALKLDDPDRVVFHEITKGAVEAALAEPRKIDRGLVSAQEARRVIDRLVGYKLSPLLWRKVRTGLSAGRVQSVAVRLVVDREAEIDAFVTKESWTVDAILEKDKAAFAARLVGKRGESPAADVDKLELGTEAEARTVADALGIDADGRATAATPAFTVEGIEARETSRQAPIPYTTSTLQQDASTRLRLSPRRTMSMAQQLYEGLELGSAGPVGLITYMRTDSTRISDVAKGQAADHIVIQFGKEYLRGTPARQRAAAGNIQDAHEAVRPTDVARTPESLRDQLDPAQYRLYDLIWRRFVASQMAAARFLNTRASLAAGEYLFRASGSVLQFDGFQKVWKRDDEKDKDREEHVLPALQSGERLPCVDFRREQHFTQPPPRYTEASLIKELEERGIGRPSTYAPTIEVIQERNYVRQEERRLHPTELGKTVDGVLREHFPAIVDVDFTAEMEKRLDGIEEGTRQYEPTIREWYDPFAVTLSKAEANMERVKVPARDTGELCPQCGEGSLVIREGKFGEFTGCSRYPECDYIKDRKAAAEPTGEMCPECGKPLVLRQGRRGPFVGCSGYPGCRHIKGDAPAVAADGSSAAAAPAEELGPCPDCGKPLARRSGRRGSFVGCTGYPSCKYIQAGSNQAGPSAGASAEPTGEMCPKCGKPLVKRQGRYGPFVSCSGYPGCKYRPPKAAAAEKVGAR